MYIGIQSFYFTELICFLKISFAFHLKEINQFNNIVSHVFSISIRPYLSSKYFVFVFDKKEGIVKWKIFFTDIIAIKLLEKCEFSSRRIRPYFLGAKTYDFKVIRNPATSAPCGYNFYKSGNKVLRKARRFAKICPGISFRSSSICK